MNINSYKNMNPQKQSQQVIICSKCNGNMAATHNERGAFFLCGECKKEIPITDRGTVEE